ncbi:DAR GTPase 2, mitochondrial [Impatiens glandulifera]|uniref:DAR GTPase 2, mitochondrial n=1 Tax=Impatiens glandulifera TaxID=253017 RepID=UPI001FB185BF|nr:DAR GTPase 2, mitochondrial [Impatiens glandulifera]
MAGKQRSIWFTTHMAAASYAIAERIPMVDIVLEVRDARAPISSSIYELFKNFIHDSNQDKNLVGGSQIKAPFSFNCNLLKNFSNDANHVIVLNKMDLASRSQRKEWESYFRQMNYNCYAVNAHNKENIKEFLISLQSQVKELKQPKHSSHTFSLMLVGIPNVGKSALANSLHHIGRISAAEKGRLKHATVSPFPVETKDISALKIGSHPSIYVLDTPGVLPPYISSNNVYRKLALTDSIRDPLVGELELAQVFLRLFNLSDEYIKWGKHSSIITDSRNEKTRKGQYSTDHTQDFIVGDVRKTLYDSLASFEGDLEDENCMEKLIGEQFEALKKAFRLCEESEEMVNNKLASKLLDLYRIGRLGHYTLDSLPVD